LGSMNLITAFLYLMLGLCSTCLRSEIVDIDSEDNIVYFTQSSPNTLVRYDLASQTFLPEIPLSQTPNALGVIKSKILVAYDHSVYTINSKSHEETLVSDIDFIVSDIQTINSLLYILGADRELEVFSLNNFSYVTSAKLLPKAHGSDKHQAFFFQYGGKLLKQTRNDNGEREEVKRVPILSYAPQIHLLQARDQILTSAGELFSAEDLSYQGSIPYEVNDVAFVKDLMVIRDGKRIVSLGSKLFEQGSLKLDQAPIFLDSNNKNLIAFDEVKGKISATPIRLSKLKSKNKRSSKKPSNKQTIFKADYFALNAKQKEIYLVDKELQSVFWRTYDANDISKQLSLRDRPTAIQFAPSQHRLYVGYADGRITYINTRAKRSSEVNFAAVARGVYALFMASGHLLAVDDAGRIVSYKKNGSIGSYIDTERQYFDYTWNAKLGKVLFTTIPPVFYAKWLSFDPVTGKFGDIEKSSNSLGNQAVTPVSLSPDDEKLILASGKIYQPEELDLVATLPNTVQQSTWIGSRLFTLKKERGSYSLQAWSSSFELETEYRLENSPHYQLMSDDKNLILVSQSKHGHDFDIFDPRLDEDNDSIANFNDNCRRTKNPDQSNFDHDLQGDACDSDDDNDQIPDLDENRFGLNTLDPNDAGFDIDLDGFSNVIEFMNKSELDNKHSVPDSITSFSEPFEAKQLSKLHFQAEENNTGWKIDNTFFARGSQSIKSGSVKDKATSALTLTSPLPPGTVYFDLAAPSACTFNFFIQTNAHGPKQNIECKQTPEWQSIQFSLPEGAQNLQLVYVNDGSGPIWIDNLLFVAD